MKLQPITVVYGTDHNFVHVLASSLFSLLQANKDARVYIIIDYNVNDADKELLSGIGKHFGNDDIYFVDTPDFNCIAGIDLDVKRYSLSMFSRLAVGSLLPASLERVIYIDCDTMIMDSLSDLWTYDLGGATIGAVCDCRSRLYNFNLGIKKEHAYINSGVLLIDLNQYRAQQWEQRLIQGIAKFNGYLEFPDNDLICKMMQDHIALLPIRYNVNSAIRMCSYEEIKLLRHPTHLCSEEEYVHAVQNPAILHFTTFFMMNGRPWITGCDHPDTEKYLEIRKAAVGAPPVPAQAKTGVKALVSKLLQIFPRHMALWGFGLTHAYLKPLLQMRSTRVCRQKNGEML